MKSDMFTIIGAQHDPSERRRPHGTESIGGRDWKKKIPQRRSALVVARPHYRPTGGRCLTQLARRRDMYGLDLRTGPFADDLRSLPLRWTAHHPNGQASRLMAGSGPHLPTSNHPT